MLKWGESSILPWVWSWVSAAVLAATLRSPPSCTFTSCGLCVPWLASEARLALIILKIRENQRWESVNHIYTHIYALSDGEGSGLYSVCPSPCYSLQVRNLWCFDLFTLNDLLQSWCQHFKVGLVLFVWCNLGPIESNRSFCYLL